MPSLALGFLDLLDDGEEDGVLGVLTVVFRAPAVTVVTADVVTSLKPRQIIFLNCNIVTCLHAGPLATVMSTLNSRILAVMVMIQLLDHLVE